MDSQASSAFSTVEAERDAPDALGMHVASLRLYEDFYRLGNAESSSVRLLDIITKAKAVVHAPGLRVEHQVRRFALPACQGDASHNAGKGTLRCAQSLCKLVQRCRTARGR